MISYAYNKLGMGLDFDNIFRAPSISVAPSLHSETPSEISSVESDWSDLRAIALKLGVSNADELVTDRFKVDRQKLEQLIKSDGPDATTNGAELFFDNIMKTSDTFVSWPCRLKVGAKSKKDPHVRIVGKPAEVEKAKERILATLDSRGSRVIMKMDVSYTDHSFIIGRGGKNIKRIMEDTKTHIHFPDSNRSNPIEKSNQVSLCGSLDGVERARSLVRLSTPLLISFELPVTGAGQHQPDHDEPYVQMIELNYNVQVIFSSRPKLHSSLVLVKGAERDADKVKEATKLLIKFTCEGVLKEIPVNIQLEISPQHHDVVKGKDNATLLNIMKRTTTKIIFPDLSDANVKPLKKSQVTISGRIDDVYTARQQLLGNLPVALIFDFPDNQSEASDILRLSTKYGVYITLRQKQRQSALAIVIKGMEKFVDKIYEARNEILNLTMPALKPEVPVTYFAPEDKQFDSEYRTQLTSLLSGYTDSLRSPANSGILHGSGSCNSNNDGGASSNANNIPKDMNNNITGGNNSNGILLGNVCRNNYLAGNLQQQSYANTLMTGAGNAPANGTNNYLTLMATLQQQQQQQQQGQAGPREKPPLLGPPPGLAKHHMSPRNSYSSGTSGYQSLSSSTNSLEQSLSALSGMNLTQHQQQQQQQQQNGLLRHPFSTDEASYAARYGRRSSDGVLLGLPPHAGNELRNGLPYELRNNPIYDFDPKRAAAYKLMERRAMPGELRTPTASWMGMGLSQTSPAPPISVPNSLENCATATDNMQQHWTRPNGSKLAFGGAYGSPYNLGVTTSLMDSTPLNRRLQMTHHKDIHSLLASLGLEHYIKIFVLNEIDLELFETLNEENLVELGITAFGARKKMLCAILALQAKSHAVNGKMLPQQTQPPSLASGSVPSAAASVPPAPPTMQAQKPTLNGGKTSPRFSGSAAPGAERRPSSQW